MRSKRFLIMIVSLSFIAISSVALAGQCLFCKMPTHETPVVDTETGHCNLCESCKKKWNEKALQKTSQYLVREVERDEDGRILGQHDRVVKETDLDGTMTQICLLPDSI